MKLVITAITGGGLSGGFRKYLDIMLPRLCRRLGPDRVMLVVPPSFLDVYGNLPCHVSALQPRQLRARQEVGEAIRQFGPDVILHANTHPFLTPGIPSVTMIQNMEMLAMPIGRNGLADVVRNLSRRVIAIRAVRQADRLLAISNFVRDWAVDNLAFPYDRIDLVPFGCDDAGVPGVDEAPPLSAVSDPSRCILTAGALRPYRALEDVFNAFARCAAVSTTLVVAGDADPTGMWYKRRLQKLVRRLGVEDRVMWLGDVGRPTLRWWMRHAGVFVMSSRVEACPNLALEAMAAGANIVSSTSPPMPEFFAGSAQYYNPGEVGRLALLLGEQLDPAAMNSTAAKRQAALAVARTLTWDEAVDGTLRSLESAIRHPSTGDVGEDR